MTDHTVGDYVITKTATGWTVLRINKWTGALTDTLRDFPTLATARAWAKTRKAA